MATPRRNRRGHDLVVIEKNAGIPTVSNRNLRRFEQLLPVTVRATIPTGLEVEELHRPKVRSRR